MSISFEIGAELRTDEGKGASRRLRRDNRVPAVVYGAGKEAVSLSLAANEVARNLDEEAFYSHILKLNIGGADSERVVLKDVQRHPYKSIVMHMDFMRVRDDQEIQMHVPLHFINEEDCVGVKQGGGVISHIDVEILVSCLPKNLPEFVEVDLGGLNVGESVHLSDVKLPEGVVSVELAHGEDHDRAVAAVHATRASKDAESESSEDE